MPTTLRELSGVPPSVPVLKDSVLVIVDAQNEYVPAASSPTYLFRYSDGHLKTANDVSTRKAISELLERYRDAKSSVIHVVHDTPEGAPIFTPSTPLAEIFPELTPQSHEAVVHKAVPGAFTDTRLDDLIKQTGKQQVVLVGYMAHVCVSTTARQASEKGYDVILAKGAIGDRDIPGAKAEAVVDTVLKELADAFGTVVDVGQIA
ncbi:hypothetical protein P7C73_g2223, partial [Tremellales sp. Uapishka_1]